MVQSGFAGVPQTLDLLRDNGLKAAIVARQSIPFGPVLRQRAAYLAHCGADVSGGREELVVIRADKPA
jgi:release factor glutamine methyltransferase